ncbi:hypothetical protein OQA88_7537 [Cercophora sp. LCS_1]
MFRAAIGFLATPSSSAELRTSKYEAFGCSRGISLFWVTILRRIPADAVDDSSKDISLILISIVITSTGNLGLASRNPFFMAPMRQPTLLTQRLRLVPLAGDHLEYEILLDADPEVVRYVGDGRPRSRFEVKELHRQRIGGAEQVPGLGFWAGFLWPSEQTSTEEFVGWWILEPPQRLDQGPFEGQAELGYRLMKKFWRQGLAKEGAKELLKYGFGRLGLYRIYAETMAVNKASRATMASVGMSHVRTFYPQFEDPIPGSDEGEVEYAITLQEWQASGNDRGLLEDENGVDEV